MGREPRWPLGPIGTLPEGAVDELELRADGTGSWDLLADGEPLLVGLTSDQVWLRTDPPAVEVTLTARRMVLTASDAPGSDPRSVDVAERAAFLDQFAPPPAPIFVTEEHE